MASRKILTKASDLQWSENIRLAAGLKAQSNPTQPSPYTRLSTPQTRLRNRYADIAPFTSNSIHLRAPQHLPIYINASPIHLKSSRTGKDRKWIATQGPKQATTAHLWRMLFDETGTPQDTATMIMLTQTHEAGREKCARYYPLNMTDPVMEIPDLEDHGDGWRCKLELLGLEHLRELRSERRKIRMTVWTVVEGRVTERSKVVWHYLYAAWPDFGVPEAGDRAALVELVRTVRRVPAEDDVGGSEGGAAEEVPRIVHCSAGVGRSGTFIALDHLMEELEDGMLDGPTAADQDPICETVDVMRQQRMMMVQGEYQFLFLYETMRELWRRRHGLQ